MRLLGLLEGMLSPSWQKPSDAKLRALIEDVRAESQAGIEAAGHDAGLTERANAYAKRRATELSRSIASEQSEAERDAIAEYAIAQTFVIGYAAGVESERMPIHRRKRK